jgi:glutamate carboxypeptidase
MVSLMFESIDNQKLVQFFEANLTNYLDLLSQMVSINSFTTNSEGVNTLGNLTVSIFEKLGFEAERFQSANPFYGDHLVLTRRARSREEAPTIGLVSHLDTVFPPDDEKRNNFFWRIEGQRAFGPGTVDIKGGTVMIYMILNGLQEFAAELYESIDWVILINSAEEMLEPQFGTLCREKLPKDSLACLVFEGGRLGKSTFTVVTARKGMATFRIVVEGRASHAGSAHGKGANAIVQLAHTISRIAELTDYGKGITYNTATIAGGTVLNRVPHMAVASGEMRAFSPEVLEEGLAQLRSLQNDVQVQSSNGSYRCGVDVNIMDQWRPWPPNQATNRLFSVWQAAGSDLGFEVAFQERGGLSDGNWLWDHVPTLDGLGPSGGNAHCSERSEDGRKEQEFVNIKSFVPKATLNTLAIINLIEARGKE